MIIELLNTIESFTDGWEFEDYDSHQWFAFYMGVKISLYKAYPEYTDYIKCFVDTKLNIKLSNMGVTK